RKTVASYFFRAQFGQQQPRPRQPQRLAYSGPDESPSHDAGAALGGGGTAPAGRQAAGAQRPAAARVDDLGMSKRAAGGAVAGAGAAGPDPRQLATNRGGEAEKQEPVTVEAEPGRNDPCPCGSGKKYKKCHGRG